MTITDQNTEQRILEAARKVFLIKGFNGARMQEIADEAGINKALLHYYFRNKEKLFEEIFREAFDRLLPQLADIFRQPISLFEKIEQFVEGYIGVVIEQPYIPVFVLGEIHRNPDEFFAKYMRPDMPDNVQFIGQQFMEAIQRAEIRRIDPRQLMINIMSMCVFPFAARPMLQHMMQLSDDQFQHLLQERKKAVSQFVIQAIKP